MSLELWVLIFVLNKRVLQHLDAAWFVLFLGTAAHAAENRSAVVHQHYLLETCLLLVPQNFFAHMVITFLQLSQTP